MDRPAAAENGPTFKPGPFASWSVPGVWLQSGQLGPPAAVSSLSRLPAMGGAASSLQSGDEGGCRYSGSGVGVVSSL